jgi:hypothetical protein
MPATEPTLQLMVWPGDGRTMLRLPGGLWVDEAPVTHADYARFLAATGHPAPRSWGGGEPPPGREHLPVVDVDIEDARAYARQANKRLPLQREWQRAVDVLDLSTHLGGGTVWEWTGSPHGEGHVVRGGPYRNQPGTRGEARHRSWEDAAARDLGFRCVADDSERTLPTMAASFVDDDVVVDAGVDAIHTTPRGVAIVGDGVVVHVDVADHELLVRAPGQRRRYGLTSAGLLAAVRLAWRLSAERHPESAILWAIDAVLRHHAVRARPELDGVEGTMADRGFDVLPPLWWSRGVLRRVHAVKDLLRLRPAAIALQMLDGREDTDDTSPEYAALLAETLMDWPRLYRHPQSTARSVHRTLALFGDEATPTALWGLRGLPLKAPVHSLQHLEVLGHLALVIADEGEFTRLRDIVERAATSALGEALVLVAEGEVITRQAWQTPAGQLAEILAAISVAELQQHLDRRPRFEELLEEALHALRHVLRLRTLVAEPPIPPPAVPGLRFLATVAEIADEGVRMDHCVATRAPRALAGKSFLFHLDHEGQAATAEVLASGELAEVRGPRNHNNGACHRARRILRPWARIVGLLHPDARPFVIPGDARVPAGLRLLRSPAEVARATLALLPAAKDGGEQLTAFAVQLTSDAARGHALVAVGAAQGLCRLSFEGLWITCSADLPEPTIVDGQLHAPPDDQAPPLVLGPYDANPDEAPPGWYDDEDAGEWDMIT